MRKVVLVTLGVVALLAYACCRMASEANRIEELRR